VATTKKVVSPQANRRKNARRNPAVKQFNNNTYHSTHREEERQYSLEYSRTKKKVFGTYAEELNERRNPVFAEVESIFFTCDYHIPFVHQVLFQRLLDACDDTGVKTLAIGGDFWDCDNYSKFLHITPMTCFGDEIDEVKKVMKMLLRHFDKIYVCRGNHEKRWLDMNAGRMEMKDLFKLAMPSNISEDDYTARVHVTGDDYMEFMCSGEKWRISHPRNFSCTPLSVVTKLARRHHCNHVGAHGHQMAQGWSEDGVNRVVDGGGLFDPDALEYLRDTSTYARVQNGFYALIDGKLEVYPGVEKR
jgi:hypothetical protein